MYFIYYMFRNFIAIFRERSWEILNWGVVDRLMWMDLLCLVMCACHHHVISHNTLIHNIPSTAPQLNISQKALGTLPEDGNLMPKHVGATIHN
jgi:hypothetical protein